MPPSSLPIHTRCNPSSSWCGYAAPRALHSFPTRRSSDLYRVVRTVAVGDGPIGIDLIGTPGNEFDPDRKSTRLNSSHLVNSYAVFCLKKKKQRCAQLKKALSELRRSGESRVDDKQQKNAT